MNQIPVKEAAPSEADLKRLEMRAKSVLTALNDGMGEHRFPVVFEFSGSPKAGKSSIISIVSLFLRRMKFRVSAPPEGASIETPPDLKDDLLVFNTWCGCYALRAILERSHDGDPVDILILDRGLFDWSVWMRYLAEIERSVDADVSHVIQRFARLPCWTERESAVFVFLADHATALRRERKSQLTVQPGRTMNPEFLADLLGCYRSCLSDVNVGANVFCVDTSIYDDREVDFSRVAFEVVSRMLDIIQDKASQQLLVADRLPTSGFIPIDDSSRAILVKTAESPKFVQRDEAERSNEFQQIVPYGMLMSQDGKYLCSRRKVEKGSPDISGKRTFLFGGHAEKRDYRRDDPFSVYRTCLIREIGEELIGLRVEAAEIVGLINDKVSTKGSRHLAVLHQVKIAGRAAIRRQTADREFTRDGAEWCTKEEIVAKVRDFDSWSRIAAAAIFGAEVDPNESTLFSK